MVAWYVALLLRKAAIVPAAAVTAVILGSTYGTFDLAARATAATLSFPKKRRKWTRLVASVASVPAILIAVGIRETVFAPPFVPPPDLPIEGVPLEQRIRNAAAIAAHQLQHYPASHRFTTSFIAGSCGGIVYALTAWQYNRGRVQKEEVMQAGVGDYAAGEDGGEHSFNDDETNVHTDEDVEGMGYDSAGQARERRQQEQQSSTGDAAKKEEERRKRQQARGGPSHFEQAADPFAALGLQNYAPARVQHDLFDQLHDSGAGSSAQSAQRGSSGGRAGQGRQKKVEEREEEFIESYSDKWRGKHDPVDAARRMGGEELTTSDPYAPSTEETSVTYDELPQGRA